MYTLFLDSATKILYISLLKDNEILFERYVSGKNDHAKNIVSTIDEALNSNNITTDNLDRIIVGIGPGSYTGVRMGVAVAKMMATFKNIKLYSISTLALMASGSSGLVKATIDARRGNCFGAMIDVDNRKYEKIEAMYSYSDLDLLCNVSVTEDSYKVNPIVALDFIKEVAEPHLLVPNYLRDTEAERNLND